MSGVTRAVSDSGRSSDNRSNAGAHISARCRACAATSSGAATAWVAPTWLRSSSESTMEFSRSASSSARSASPGSASVEAAVARRFSSRSRRAVSGLPSWCEASAIRLRCWAWEVSTLSAIWLNDRARCRSSGGPASAGTRVARLPSASCSAAASRSCTGRRIHRTNGPTTPTAVSTSTASPASTSSPSRIPTSRCSRVVGTSSTTAPSTCASRPTGEPSTIWSSTHGHTVRGCGVPLPDSAWSTAAATAGSSTCTSSLEEATTSALASVTTTVPPYTSAYRTRSVSSSLNRPSSSARSASTANRLTSVSRRTNTSWVRSCA